MSYMSRKYQNRYHLESGRSRRTGVDLSSFVFLTFAGMVGCGTIWVIMVNYIK